MSARGRDKKYQRGIKVVARTRRGLESGEVLCEATEDVVAEMSSPAHGEILREMSSEDANELAHIQGQAGNEFEVCQQYVSKLELDMELVDLEHVFGGERIVIYYLAENRIDFRELVRQLAGEFQTRIEMRQISTREEAGRLSGVDTCGLVLCCSSFLTDFKPVYPRGRGDGPMNNMDSHRIGVCGRIKCCLLYEEEDWTLIRRKPPVLIRPVRR